MLGRRWSNDLCRLRWRRRSGMLGSLRRGLRGKRFLWGSRRRRGGIRFDCLGLYRSGPSMRGCIFCNNDRLRCKMTLHIQVTQITCASHTNHKQPHHHYNQSPDYAELFGRLGLDRGRLRNSQLRLILLRRFLWSDGQRGWRHLGASFNRK